MQDNYTVYVKGCHCSPLVVVMKNLNSQAFRPSLQCNKNVVFFFSHASLLIQMARTILFSMEDGKYRDKVAYHVII